jgi:hypothetical protein
MHEHEHVAALLNDYDRSADLPPAEIAAALRRHGWLSEIAPAHLDGLLDALLERAPPAPQSGAEAMLATIFAQFSLPFRTPGAKAIGLPAETRVRVETLYRHLGAASRARHELLALLAAAGGADDLHALAELTAGDPPAVAETFLGPLFQRRDYDPAPLFPRLLDALQHLGLASPVLDLANFLTRAGRVETHPAASRSDRLATLLGDLTHALNRLEESPPPPVEAEQAHRRVNESVSLAVSLCDALALIGDRAHVGKLFQASELAHRRIRTEAAYALAKLGEKAGEDLLVALASEPAVRLRVLAYADELGLSERVAAEHQSPEARAEAELVAYLSEPTHLGLPPGQCELIDRRTQHWPGYDEPVECFLFHFTYRLGGAVYSNVGIVGPLTHAFTADLADLPPDDIYAAYAGWQAEHEDIYEVDADRLSPAAGREAERLVRRLHDASYQEIEPVMLGFFFDDYALVARAARDGVTGYAVVDAEEIDWRPSAVRRRPLGPDEVYCIYKGRKFLKAFNP